MAGGAGDGIPLVTQAISNMASAATSAATALDGLTDAQARQRANDAYSGAANAAKKTHDSFYGKGDGSQTWVSQSDLSQAEAARQNAGGGAGGAGKGNTAVAGAAGLNPLSTDVLDAEGFTVGSYKPGGPAVEAYDQSVATKLDAEAAKIRKAFGFDDSFSQTLSSIAGFIRDRRFGGDTGYKYARALLSNFAAGLQQENTDPTESASMHALEAEMLRFLTGGNFS